MLDTVKYQLDKAEDALRTALKLGAENLSPFQLHGVIKSIENINNIKLLTPHLSVNTQMDSEWDKLSERTVGRPGYKFNAVSSYVPAKQNSPNVN